MAYREFTAPALSRRSLLRSGALLGVGAGAAAVPFARAPLFAHDDMAWPSVQAALDEYVDGGKVANMVALMGFEDHDPQVLAKGTLTLNGGTPADADSLYRIYSMTKPITGMAAMMLVDEGLLGLDQPIAELLPAYATMMVQKEYDGSIEPDNLEPAERPITVRQLLTHTAGLGYGIVQSGPIADYYNQNGLIPGVVTRLDVPGIFRGAPVQGLATFADRLAEAPLVYQPGTRWSYSMGLDLLGRVIEVAAQTPFDTFLQQRIFDLCGMDSTFFRVPDSETGRLAANYAVVGGALFPIDLAENSVYLDEPPFPFGGAGLVSSPRDYDRFLQMIVNYGRIDGRAVMSERAVRLGTSNLLPDGVDLSGTWMDGQGYGAGGRVVMDGPTHSFGWGGAAGTTGFVEFRSKLRAGMFTQYMPSQEYEIQNRFPELVMADVMAVHPV